MNFRRATTGSVLLGARVATGIRRAATAALILILAGGAAPATVIISEYIEGDGENQAIELFNTGPAAVNLSTIGMSIYFNGSTTPTAVFGPGTISQTLSPGSVFTIAHTAWIFGGPVDLSDADLTYDGDDAVALYQNSVGNFLDVIGQIGFDPGVRWISGGVETRNAGMTRKPDIVTGDVNGANAFAPGLQWLAEAVNGHTLGSHNGMFKLIAADFDEDADVDGADLTARWQNNFGLSGSAAHTQGNADGDGDVDGADFLMWQRQVGTVAMTTAVPEPDVLGTVAAGLALTAPWRGRRRRPRG